jgi:hypothetical protein
VTTWRPCACNLARNAVAMPSRSTIIRVRLSVSRVLFIPFQKYGDAHGEMLFSAMGGNAQGMAVLVVQQQERAAPQNDAAFARSVRAGEARHCRRAYDAHRQKPGQRMGLGCVFCESLWEMKDAGAPTCKSRCEAVCAIGIGHEAHKNASVYR